MYMRVNYSVCLLIAFGLGCQHIPDYSPKVQTFNGVIFEYHVPWTLNDRHKADLLELSRICGVTNIEKVAAHYMLPGTSIAIYVREKESIQDRTVSQRSLMVNYENWGGGFTIPPGAKKVKQFSVLQDSVTKKTILNSAGKEYRVRLADSISIPVAEDILSRFLAKEVEFGHGRYARSSLDHDLESAEIVAIQQEVNGSLSIVFWQSYSGRTYRFHRDPVTGKITIVGIGSINV